MEGDDHRSPAEATTTSLEDNSSISQPSETPLSKTTSSDVTKSESSEEEPNAAPQPLSLPLPSLDTGTRKSAPDVTLEAESKSLLPPSPHSFSPVIFPSFPLHSSQAPLLVTPIASIAGASPSIDFRTLENGKLETLGELEADGERTEREHKKRSKNWTRQETLKLIKVRTELEPRFVKGGRKSELWDEIAESMQKESIFRDAQQCRDKWEKLSARYKEVRDGLKDREDNPFFEELHSLLSEKSVKKEKERKQGLGREEGAEAEGGGIVRDMERPGEGERAEGDAGDEWEEDDDEEKEITAPPARKKRKGAPQFSAFTQLDVVQSLLESVISKQQKLFRDLLDAMEKREQRREQERLEREDTRRAEERAQRCVFNNAMILLTQKLVGKRKDTEGAGPVSVSVPPTSPRGTQAHKKRSKNWKRTEVSQLIIVRGRLESRFASSTRRVGLWEEVAELLRAEGIKRDAKQCREKWDKLMAAYKDVGDEKRERVDNNPYFTELSAILGRRPTETVEQRQGKIP